MSHPLNAAATDNGREYVWPPTGEAFPSVTTIIKAGTPTSPYVLRWEKRANVRYAVEQWRSWMELAETDPRSVVDHIVEESERQRDEAADRGSEVHRWADAIAAGSASGPVPEELGGYVEAYQTFLDEWAPEFYFTEATVYSRRHGYAGTLDWMAWLGDELVLGDIKTKGRGKRLYGEVALQLAAYRYADFIGAPDGSELPMPTVQRCVVLVLRPEGYELVPVRAAEEEFDVFLAALTVRQFCLSADARLGAPLERP